MSKPACKDCWWWEQVLNTKPGQVSHGNCHGVLPTIPMGPIAGIMKCQPQEGLELSMDKIRKELTEAYCQPITAGSTIEYVEVPVFPVTKATDFCPKFKPNQEPAGFGPTSNVEEANPEEQDIIHKLKSARWEAGDEAPRVQAKCAKCGEPARYTVMGNGATKAACAAHVEELMQDGETAVAREE